MTTTHQPPYPPPEPPRRPGPGSGPGNGNGRGDGPGSSDGHGHGPGSGDGHGHGHDSPGSGGDGHGPGGGHGPGSGGGHGHSHSHGPAAPVSKHLRKVIAAILIPFGVAVVVGLVVLWPGGAPPHERTGVGFDRQTQQATVTKVVSLSCKSVNASGETPTGDTSTAEGSSAEQQANGTCKKATIRVDTGDDKGRTFTEIVQPDQSRQLHEGEKVVVAYEPSAPKDLQYSVTDVNRRLPMALLAGIFALVVVVVGRMRGVMALVALAVSFLILTFFILPAILQGSNPLVVAVIGASAIMLIALYMCHGLSARTSVAVLGTLLSLLLIGVLGSGFIGWAALTGNTDDNTGLIHGLYPSIDMSGLLLAGVIIGSLGVLDDVTVTQTSAVWELHEANPTMGWRGLYRAGIRIGRDHIASVVNTLVLAYAGAALPLLLLFSIAQSSVGTVANSELVAEEIVRTLVGSIGLVASVPVTTLLAALVVAADRPGPETAAAPAMAGGRPAPAAPARGGGRGRRRKR
ncbi:YibE/F family protein [Streptomyces fulvoviolaceus]|uniref:YibE/F family protein n=1 Tax=Streptomyces fulvoviolaceus TaxID=285535 RepID=UPI0021C1C5FE|nr:YibE/F family protein [Streptomyces fulvoviolaceus]MCT9076422.1 YibE/F family protein [Streptomyces fulvoviolaceus]